MARAVVEAADLAVPVEAAVTVFAHAAGPAILESSRPINTYGRFSILATDPVEVISLVGGDSHDPLGALAAAMARYPGLPGPTGEMPFVGGWIGFLGYEAGLPMSEPQAPARGLGPSLALRVRIMPHADREMAVPRARFGLYDAAAVYDHQKEQWYLTAVDWPAPFAMQRPPVAQRLNLLRERLQAASRVVRDWNLAPVDLAPEPPTPYTTRPVPNMSRQAYIAKVLAAKRYIEAGDVYQVNLTQRFTAQTTATPLELYRRLRTASPSSHAALLMWDGTSDQSGSSVAIISSSPELFLDLRDGHVVTRPIKGTRPRTGDPRIDAMARRDLAVSDKDRAELTMIVDLLRNDLGRVCSFGTVRVREPGDIEEHPTVFHRVATIEGKLKPGMGWPDLLRAAFPGGSVTGAPKIRAMQIIRELEPTPRGVYCGSIGWIGLDGAMSLNIAIRTIVQRDDMVHLYAGGGIVAQSTPDAEYEETLTKLRGMLLALNTEKPWEITRPAREAVPTP
jgi:para-aminobenzoate synthetase component 1